MYSTCLFRSALFLGVFSISAVVVIVSILIFDHTSAGAPENQSENYQRKFSYSSSELSELFTRILAADENSVFRKNASGDDGGLGINIQADVNGVPTNQDVSPLTFFSEFSAENDTFSRPTYARMIALFDNYVAAEGVAEVLSERREQEEFAFINGILDTPVWRIALTFLQGKGFVRTKSELKARLKALWFKNYSRKYGVLDSSGFEHVFVGEHKSSSAKAKVGGLHSWVRFYLLEKNDQFNYFGYLKHRPDLPKQIYMRFEWDSHLKPAGSMLYGSSPELDMAIFTICVILNPNRVSTISLPDRTLKVQTWSLRQNNQTFVGSAYPLG